MPEGVSEIILFSDGIALDAFEEGKEYAAAVRKMWRYAEKNPLSKGTATHVAKRRSARLDKYDPAGKKLVTDDASYAAFYVVEEPEKETPAGGEER